MPQLDRDADGRGDESAYVKMKDWSYGLFGCFDEMDMCISATLCWSCFVGQTVAKKRGGSCVTPCCLTCMCPCLCSCYYRHQIRMDYDIQGNQCDDCCVSFLCFCCGAIQNRREVEVNNEDVLHQPYTGYRPHNRSTYTPRTRKTSRSRAAPHSRGQSHHRDSRISSTSSSSEMARTNSITSLKNGNPYTGGKTSSLAHSEAISTREVAPLLDVTGGTGNHGTLKFLTSMAHSNANGAKNGHGDERPSSLDRSSNSLTQPLVGTDDSNGVR